MKAFSEGSLPKAGLYREISALYGSEHSPWLSTWFENSAFIKIPIEEFDLKTVSFTYGDLTLSLARDPIRWTERNTVKLYTYDEILKLIKYGLPQDWNDDGRYGPERYIEAHIWNDEIIDKYR